MTIEELKEKRLDLITDITSLISKFEKETSCTVKEVRIEHEVVYNNAGELVRSLLTNVDVDIDVNR